MNKLLILPILVFLGNYLPAQEPNPEPIEPPEHFGQNVGQDPGTMGGVAMGGNGDGDGREQWGEGSPEPVSSNQGLTEQNTCLLSQQNSLIQNDKGSENEEGAEGQKCEDGDS